MASRVVQQFVQSRLILVLPACGGEVMARSGNRVVPFAAATCCLLAAVTGCHLHRTGHGYILRGQWSLECGDLGCVSASGAEGPSSNVSALPVAPADQATANPELLPWRTRLKARLGSGLFRQKESGERERHYEDSAVSANDSSRLAAPPMPPIPPESPSITKKRATSSANASELGLPSAALSKPESRGSDVVME